MRRYLLLLAFLLWCASPAHAQTAFVKSAVGAFAAGTSTSCTFGSNTAAGNLLVMLSQGGSIPTSITDTQTSTWNNLMMSNYLGATQYASAWYAMNTTGGAETITVNWTTPITAGSICAEYSGVTLTAALDKFGEVDNPNGTTWTSTTVTTTGNNEALVVFLTSDFGSLATTAPFTQRQNLATAGTNYGALSDRVNQPIGTYTATGTTTNTSHVMAYIATFKGIAAAGRQVGAFLVGP